MKLFTWKRRTNPFSANLRRKRTPKMKLLLLPVLWYFLSLFSTFSFNNGTMSNKRIRIPCGGIQNGAVKKEVLYLPPFFQEHERKIQKHYLPTAVPFFQLLLYLFRILPHYLVLCQNARLIWMSKKFISEIKCLLTFSTKYNDFHNERMYYLCKYSWNLGMLTLL